MDDEVTVVRIYLREADHGKRTNLLKELYNILHEQHGVHRVVVFRGIEGFDERGESHASDMLRINVALPLVVEFFDKPDVADAALALIDGLVPAGHILTWRASVRGMPPAPGGAG